MTRASLWRWVLALWAISTLCAMLLRPVTPIDETRYLAVAWEMRLAGEPWLPSLNGLPYSDKPPLLFWLINAGWDLFGVNDLWPRFLTATLSLGVALLTARCAVLLCDGRPGVGSRSALVLTAFSPWLLFNGAVMFDVLLTFFSLMAIVLVLGMSGAGRLWQWGATGIALGLGMLAKGPAVLLHVLQSGSAEIEQSQRNMTVAHQRFRGFIKSAKGRGPVRIDRSQSTRRHLLKTQYQHTVGGSAGHGLTGQKQSG